MATVALANCVEQIGEVAGELWHVLDESGPQPLAKLPKKVDAPKDLVMQAVGWLAREGKLAIEEEGRSKVVCLIDNGEC